MNIFTVYAFLLLKNHELGFWGPSILSVKLAFWSDAVSDMMWQLIGLKLLHLSISFQSHCVTANTN